MTQEERELLLKDLCARLPYRVKIQVSDWTILDTTLKTGHIARLPNNNIELKPYLRPMSSMTEEEKKQYDSLTPITEVVFPCDAVPLVDWLNAHHFDYRGLIEKGLAIEAPEDMYNTK